MLAQLYRWDHYINAVSLLSLFLNSGVSNSLLTANSIARMIAVQLIAKERADTTISLGLFD